MAFTEITEAPETTEEHRSYTPTNIATVFSPTFNKRSTSEPSTKQEILNDSPLEASLVHHDGHDTSMMFLLVLGS